jgi:hypothetical protein
MDEEMRKMLEENLELAKENNKMLRKLRNGQRFATITRILYWVVLFAIAYGSYIYVSPHINTLKKIYENNKALFSGNLPSFDQYFGGKSSTPTQ